MKLSEFYKSFSFTVCLTIALFLFVLSPLYFLSLQPKEHEVTLEQRLKAIGEYLDPVLLNGLRRYLTIVRCMDFTIDETVQQQIQTDFVEMRQSNANKVSADDLHSLLSLARLLSLSLGQKQLSLETWDQVMKMEAERDSRQSSSASDSQ